MTAPGSLPPAPHAPLPIAALPLAVFLGIWPVPTFCPWCYDHDRYPYVGIRTCRVCGHILEYQVATGYDRWYGGGG